MIPDYNGAIKLIKFVAADASFFAVFALRFKMKVIPASKRPWVVLFRYLHKVIKSKPIITNVARHIKQ
jgi:hypothetical protein